MLTTKRLLVPKGLRVLVASVYTLSLLVISLVTVNNLPELGTNFDDKVYHVFAYMILSALWFYAIDIAEIDKRYFYVISGCIGFGIIIEIIQSELSPSRTGDFLDAIANCIGVILVGAYVFYRKKRLS